MLLKANCMKYDKKCLFSGMQFKYQIKVDVFSRVLESLLVAMVTTVVIFVTSMTLGECRDLSSTSHNTSAPVSTFSVPHVFSGMGDCLVHRRMLLSWQ